MDEYRDLSHKPLGKGPVRCHNQQSAIPFIRTTIEDMGVSSGRDSSSLTLKKAKCSSNLRQFFRANCVADFTEMM